MKNQPETTAPTGSGAPSAADILEHATWLRTFAVALVRDPNDADDLVQDALCAVATAPGRIDDVRGYLAGIVRWRAWKTRRSTARRLRRDRERARGDAATAPAADESLEAMDRMRVVLEEVAKLPRTQARAISLRFVEELSPADIARSEGTSPSTVRSNLARGLATLRERLDERFGGRASWCAVLVPWSLRAPADAAAAASASSVPGAAASTSPVVTTASLVASAMSLKLASIALLPLALAATWFLSRDHSVELERSQVTAGAPSATAVDAGLSRSGAAAGTLEDVAANDARSAAPTPAPPAATEAAPVDVPLIGRLVDQETGEGIGEVRVMLTPGGSDLASWTATHECVTNPDGSFESEETVPAHSFVRIATSEQPHHGGWRLAAPLDLEFPLDAAISIPIGPTFRFDLGDADAIGGSFDVEARGPGIHPKRPAESRMRLGEAPWTRFREPLAKEGTQGPWELRVLPHDGLSVGRCTVHRRVGIEPDPVHVEFEPTAAIHFFLPVTGEEVPPFLFVEVSNDAEFERTIELEVFEGKIEGWVKHLEPGTYRWTTPLTGDGGPGCVEIVAGETARIELEWDPAPSREHFALIDATAAPGVDLSQWDCVVFESEDLENRFTPSLTLAHELGTNIWRVPLGSTPRAGWMMALQPEEGYEVDRLAVPVESSTGPPTIRVTRSSAPLAVALVAVDSQTGESLTWSKAVHFDGMNIGSVTTDVDGEFESYSVSSTRATYFMVGKDGYRLTRVDFEPGRDSEALRVRLERGWRNRVVAVRLSDMGFLAGVSVHVDGELVGETGSDGSLWIEGEGPPELIELGRTDPGLVVTMSPFDRAGRGAGDPLQGYLFLLRDAGAGSVK